MAEEVKLYGAWGSPFSNRVDIALRLKGVDYKYFDVEFPSNSASSIIKYNPVYKTLPDFVHNESPTAESLVILEYIDETWKDHPFLPQDLYKRAQARFWARFIDDKVKDSHPLHTLVMSLS
ncbi:S-crystallin [Parasponia andersonii]|uniref:S-crystallin n=1 Tax=Parasponia andersonii TaxID=3476 RepID=A0A2P5CFX9_PARAD|nr:S-crystallin [Parasponia andersonii]